MTGNEHPRNALWEHLDSTESSSFESLMQEHRHPWNRGGDKTNSLNSTLTESRCVVTTIGRILLGQARAILLKGHVSISQWARLRFFWT